MSEVGPLITQWEKRSQGGHGATSGPTGISGGQASFLPPGSTPPPRAPAEGWRLCPVPQPVKKKNNKSFCWASQGPRHKEETGRPQEGGMGRGTAGRGPEGVVTARDLGEPEPPDCPWAPSGPCRPEGPAGNVGRGGAGPSGGAGSGFILLLPPTPAASGMSLSGGRESGLWKEP